jgi:UDP-N-acetyl-D-glucosamine dehydrogenase
MWGCRWCWHFAGRIRERGAAFRPSSDFSGLARMDCIVICVPTPLSRNREADMTFVFDTARTIAGYLPKGQLVVLESTTYPGTTDEDLRGILEGSGLKAGQDFFLAFSPEREDPNNRYLSTGTTPKVVGGYSAECLEVAKALYDSIVERTVPVSSTRVAEAAKLLENIYRSVNSSQPGREVVQRGEDTGAGSGLQEGCRRQEGISCFEDNPAAERRGR